MKRNEMRMLLHQAYATLDHAACEAAAERALLVLKNAPKEPESYLLMAEVAQENHKSESSLNWIDQGLVHHPGHVGLLVKKASILIDDFEEVDEAYAILQGIADSFSGKTLSNIKREFGAPLALDIYLLLTDCLRLKGQYFAAKSYAAMAKDIAPYDESALLSLATAIF